MGDYKQENLDNLVDEFSDFIKFEKQNLDNLVTGLNKNQKNDLLRNEKYLETISLHQRYCEGVDVSSREVYESMMKLNDYIKKQVLRETESVYGAGII